jgi:hypothetical protein
MTTGTRSNSKTQQDFTRVQLVDGVATLVVALTAVATTDRCSADTVDSDISYPVFCSLLGLDNAAPNQRINVAYTVDQGEQAVVRYVERTWKGTMGAAHTMLAKTAGRSTDWIAYLLAGLADLFNAATGAVDTKGAFDQRWDAVCDRVQALQGFDCSKLVADLQQSAALAADGNVDTGNWILDQMTIPLENLERKAADGRINTDAATYGTDALALADRIASEQNGCGNPDLGISGDVTPDQGWDCMGTTRLDVAGAPYKMLMVGGKFHAQC